VSAAECEQAFFNHPLVTSPDTGHSSYEARFYTLGKSDSGKYLFIVFTLRNNFIRVISARDMNRKERGRCRAACQQRARAGKAGWNTFSALTYNPPSGLDSTGNVRPKFNRGLIGSKMVSVHLCLFFKSFANLPKMMNDWRPGSCPTKQDKFPGFPDYSYSSSPTSLLCKLSQLTIYL